MKTTTLVHRKREMEITVNENGQKYGATTLTGRIEWTKNNYEQFATFFVATIHGEKVIKWDYKKDLTKTMETELATILAEKFIK